MRLLLLRFPAVGGLLLFALLCAAMDGTQYLKSQGAPIIVTNTNDSGPGSLRQALADAPTPTATPTSGILLISRLSDASAYATGGAGIVNPPPEIQTDFLPASLSNTASSIGEPGLARGNCTSNSQIELDNQIGTLQIAGDGMAGADVFGTGTSFYAWASAKLIVISFTLTDRSYPYSLTGQLSAAGDPGPEHSNLATAKLTRGGVTIFEVIADHSTVTLSETGILQPDNYTLAVDIDAYAYAQAGQSFGNSSANFNFAIGPTPTPTATATASPTATATATATATPSPSPTPAAQALNLSTRMLVQTADNAGIGGFIITGSAPKQVTVRGIGPSLANFGVPNPLVDPILELHGPPGFVTIINDNWRDSNTNCTNTPGPAPTNDLESAICGEILDPGAYTAILRGKTDGTGVGLVEVYDVGQAAPSKLANISTRAFVSTGNDIVVAGFILGGHSANDSVILRGIGPSLTAFGVPNALADPTLDLRDSNGAVVRTNNDWQDDPAQAAIMSVAGLAPTNPLESGIAETLPPGQYTVLLAGLNNGTGVGLVEVYDRRAP